MGGPPAVAAVWAFLFPLLLCCSISTIVALSADKPDLLRFILNVKPGIREPTPPPPRKEGQGRVVPGSGASSGTGFNAFSIANVGRGQSASASSQQSMQSGGSGFGGGQRGSAGAGQSKSTMGNENQKQMGSGGGMSPSKPTSPQSGQSAAGNGQQKSTANQKQQKPPPPSPPIAPSRPKPNAEDPYGLEIGGNVVETTTQSTTQAQTTKATAPPSTTPPPTTTTASTTTTTKMPPCGPDVLFVLDSTGSVRLVYNDQRNYILDVAKQMDIGPNGQHVGLILYSSKVKQRIVVGLDEPKSKEEFLQIVQELPYHGGITATGTALELTVKALAKRRPNKRTLVVVLTDGFTYDDWEVPSRNLQSFGSGVDVIVAGDVKNYARGILEKIAGDPGRVLLGEENKPKALDYLRCR